MIKKQLKKLEIGEMGDFLIIDSEEQILLKGGYTMSEAEVMMDNGTWIGGFVDGYGYVGAAASITGLPNDGRYHVGSSSTCKRCHMMSGGLLGDPFIYSPSNLEDGSAGFALGIQFCHWLGI